MNIVKKEWVYKCGADIDAEYGAKELADYEFDGQVEFTSLPINRYDINNHIIMPFVNNEFNFMTVSKVLINDQYTDLKELNPRTISVEKIQLSGKYGLQQFFDEHKKAKCIVFYTDHGTIFHTGYTIRVFIDEEGSTPENTTN